jgi:ribosome-associated protein
VNSNVDGVKLSRFDANLPPNDARIELAPGVTIVPAALRFAFSRSSGPGGQNVNKLNTKAELWVPIDALIGLTDRAKERLIALAGKRLTQAGEIHLTAETGRSQEGNRAEVMERLRELLIAARHEPTRRRKTKPTHASRQRRLKEKKQRSEIKQHRQFRKDES